MTHDFSHPVDTNPPKVCVVLVLHRPADHPYTVEALDSLRTQTYANLEAQTVDNTAGEATIGQCRNLAVRQTDAELVLFMGEEDMLTPDTVQSMVDLYQLARRTELQSVVHVTTQMMVLLENGNRAPLPSLTAPGMYEREYLLNNPFDASLDYNVDRAQHRNLQGLAQVKGQPVTFAVTHHFGYILRMHPFRRDGINVRVQ